MSVSSDEQKGPIKVTTTPAKIDLATLPDSAWSRPRLDARAETGALLVGLLRAITEPMSMQQVRQAALWAMEPDLLLPYLKKAEAAQWRRLIGSEADAKSPAVSKFVANANASWGSAVTTLRGNRVLLEDLQAHTWAPGPALADPELPAGEWIEGRARFVMNILKRVGSDKAAENLSQDRQGWVSHGAGHR